MQTLAIHGGPKAKTTPTIPMYPGGLEIGEAEKAQVLEVLDRKYLFRYYGPKDVPSKVNEFEKAFAAHMSSKHCLAVPPCTSAPIDARIAVGVGSGSEVIVNEYALARERAVQLMDGPAGERRRPPGVPVFDRKVFPFCCYFASHGAMGGAFTGLLQPCTSLPVHVNEAAEKGGCAQLRPGDVLTTTVVWTYWNRGASYGLVR